MTDWGFANFSNPAAGSLKNNSFTHSEWDHWPVRLALAKRPRLYIKSTLFFTVRHSLLAQVRTQKCWYASLHNISKSRRKMLNFFFQNFPENPPSRALQVLQIIELLFFKCTGRQLRDISSGWTSRTIWTREIVRLINFFHRVARLIDSCTIYYYLLFLNTSM